MKRILFLLFTAIAAAACKPSVPAGEFLIAGEVKNTPDSALLYLYEPKGKLLRRIAVDTLVNGKFSFRDTVSSPKVLLVCANGEGYANWLLKVWVSPGELVNINGEDKLVGLWEISSKIPEQREENRYHAEIVPEMREMMRLAILENSLQTQEQRDSIYDLTQKQFSRISAKSIHYMQTAPITTIWMDKLVEYSESLQYGIGTDSREEMLALYDRMPEAQRQSRKGRLIEAYLNPPEAVGIGDRMADGDLYDVDGNRHRLAEFAGKYILLDFWSLGCGPCVMAIPELEEIAERNNDRVAVVSISCDPESEWKDYLAKHQLDGNQWNQLLDGNVGLSVSYQMKGLPHFVLIAPDGTIQDVWSGYGTGSLLGKIEENIK